MAKWVEFASGKYMEQYNTLYCEATTREYNGKQYSSRIYDSETKQAEQRQLQIVLRDVNTGEEIVVNKFQISENKNRTEDWQPTHRVQLKLG